LESLPGEARAGAFAVPWRPVLPPLRMSVDLICDLPARRSGDHSGAFCSAVAERG